MSCINAINASKAIMHELSWNASIKSIKLMIAINELTVNSRRRPGEFLRSPPWRYLDATRGVISIAHLHFDGKDRDLSADVSDHRAFVGVAMQ